MKKLILAFACLFVVVPSQARTITVDDDGVADFNNIQAAIDDANDGDEIVVADGNYTGPGNRDIDYNGLAITVRSQNGPTNCIIDCNASSSDKHRGFIFQNGEGPNSVLSGLTIIDGYGKIIAGEDFSGGGAILCKGSGPTIIGCIISGNSAGHGGGVYCNAGSNPKVINCIFEDNSASTFGGAFMCFAHATYPFPELVNCTLTNNDAGEEGGGIALVGSVHDDGSVRVRNSIIWNNTPTDEPGIVTPLCCKCGCVRLYVDHTILQIDWQGVWNSNIVGMGNVIADPCFADPCRGDYHLKSQAGRWDPNSESWAKDSMTSPAIDAGNPGCPLGDEPNDANNVRISMGAYGGTAEASKTPADWRSIADFTNDWSVDYNDLSIFVDYWLQAGQCIPSDLDRSQSVNLKDFSIFAREWPLCGAHLSYWNLVGRPECWCASVNPRQCHGDADGRAETKGRYWVYLEDLNILLAAWQVEGWTLLDPHGDFLTYTSYWGEEIPLVCADFDHLTETKHLVRVYVRDLNILLTNWGTYRVEPDCP